MTNWYPSCNRHWMIIEFPGRFLYMNTTLSECFGLTCFSHVNLECHCITSSSEVNTWFPHCLEFVILTTTAYSLTGRLSKWRKSNIICFVNYMTIFKLSWLGYGDLFFFQPLWMTLTIKPNNKAVHPELDSSPLQQIFRWNLQGETDVCKLPGKLMYLSRL